MEKETKEIGISSESDQVPVKKKTSGRDKEKQKTGQENERLESNRTPIHSNSIYTKNPPHTENKNFKNKKFPTHKKQKT